LGGVDPEKTLSSHLTQPDKKRYALDITNFQANTVISKPQTRCIVHTFYSFGSIPGIRRLQASLLKTALIFGAKLYTGVTFEQVVEPKSLEDGWKCQVSPENHPVSSFEFDVLIGADGKKNVLPGFQQIEMRGELEIIMLTGCPWSST